MENSKTCLTAQYTFSADLQKRLTRKALIISSIAFAVGVAGLLAYIIWGTIWETKYDYTPKACEALLACAVPFVLGLVVMLTIRSSIKSARTKEGVKRLYEFYADLINFYETKNGETGNVKITYNQVVKSKIKNGFLYLYCFNMTVLYVADISEWSEEEKNTVSKLLRKPVPENAPVLELKNFVGISDN